MSQYILFYSQKCKYSVNFINILHKINARSYFTFISVDRDPKTKQRHTAVQKFQIQMVPTIIINDQVYVGNQALIWLKNLITDMGLSGPPAIGSRNNKEGYEVAPNKSGNDNDGENLSGYDPNENSFLSVDNNLDSGNLNYIVEDGQSHRENSNKYQINHQSILPSEVARDLDIQLLREGNKNNKGGGSSNQKQRTGLRNDALKQKQQQSEYEKYRRMRDNEVPKQRQDPIDFDL